MAPDAAAAVLFLGNRGGAAPLTGLAAVRDSLEREVLRLRGSKASMTQDAYDRRLESLLLELARVSRALREQEGRKP